MLKRCLFSGTFTHKVVIVTTLQKVKKRQKTSKSAIKCPKKHENLPKKA